MAATTPTAAVAAETPAVEEPKEAAEPTYDEGTAEDMEEEAMEVDPVDSPLDAD